MKMKMVIACTLFIGMGSLLASAQEKKTVSSKLNEATVFFKGAELVHSASTNVTQGDNVIWIEGLSPEIDKNSLKISATNGIVVSAFEYSVDYLSSTKTAVNPAIQKMQDSITYYQQKVALVDTEIKVNVELVNILKKSTDKNIAGSEKGMSIDELIKTMEYYKQKQTELENTQRANEKKRNEFNNSITRLSNQVKQESVKNNKTSGLLKLTFNSPLATNANFTISYYTPLASWVSYYDINVESTDKPIKFVSKAKVRQITGLDWDKVKLTLSSATPSNGKIASLFSAWFLQDRTVEVQAYAYGRVSRLSKQYVQNSVSYIKDIANQGEFTGRVDVESTERTKKISKNMKEEETSLPIYIVDGTPVDASYYMAIDRSMVKSERFMQEKEAVKKYGDGASDGAYVIELKSSMDDYVNQSDSELNMIFNISIPYNIPGNGKEQTISLPTKEASGEFKYYCAPKLDKDTYLLVEISDWQKLGLLSGKASITYEGTYVGETFIDASSTMEKLPLTLGADKRVTVKREKMKELSSTRFLGSDIKQVFKYKLTVRNNQNKAIKLVLKDQYPISNTKNIEVEFLEKETTPFSMNKEDVGVITWEQEINTGETKEFRFSYSVKYPKDSNLNL